MDRKGCCLNSALRLNNFGRTFLARVGPGVWSKDACGDFVTPEKLRVIYGEDRIPRVRRPLSV
jgi:hypothetical protein